MSEGIRAPNLPLGTSLGEFIGHEIVGSVKSLKRFSRASVLGGIEAITNSFTVGGGVIFTTLAQAQANLAYDAYKMAWVIQDATAANNGVYQKSGASGSGSWARLGDLPYSFYRAVNTGTGTANAIKAANGYPMASKDALIVVNITDTNTASPVTLSLNGGTALTIKTASGTDPAVGGLVVGMVLAGYIDEGGTQFRMLSDQASAAIVPAAEAAQAAAEVARDAAIGAVPNVFSPTRADLKALDTATITASFLKEDGREGQFVFEAGDFSTQVALDTAEAVYIKADAIAATAGAWVRQYTGPVVLTWFGAKGDDATDNATAFAAATAFLEAGYNVIGPEGVFRTSVPITITEPAQFTGETGFRIKLTAAASYVVMVDFSAGGAFWNYGARVSNMILDGNGFATDGLFIKHVISSHFDNIRATNITQAGMHCQFMQLCTAHNFICSGNVEAFTTTPSNGILADGATSSANLFHNPCIEHVSGSGIKGISFLNTVFVNGTSEGNSVGIEFGEDVAAGRTCVGNTVIGMDLEVNATSDIVLRLTANSNDFVGLKAGFASGAVQILSSKANTFHGGTVGGVSIDASSSDNHIYGTKLYGSAKTITDLGTRNTWTGVYNISDGAYLADSPNAYRSRTSIPSGTLSIDASKDQSIVAEVTGPAVTIGTPTKPRHGQSLDITIWNVSLGAITITWPANFKMAGWTNPANGFNRSVRLIYDADYTAWYQQSISAADIAN